MGIFDRFKKSKETEKKPQADIKPAKVKSEPAKKKKKDEKRPFDPSLVPSGKEEKPKIAKQDQNAEVKPKKLKKEDTGNAYRIILKPLLTEKSTELGSVGKYVFQVANNVNKIEIEEAIRNLYGVNVVKINIINQGGKPIQYGHSSGRTKGWKKAIVTLKAGEKIEIYEGV